MLRTQLPAAPPALQARSGRSARGCAPLRAAARAPLRVVAVRNRGRLRDPYDTPLRDGNRDRLYGLLTSRAAATLLAYCFETNQVQAKWLTTFLSENPVPRKGTWAEVSGDVMLKKLMCMEMQTLANPYTGDSLTIDPRNLAQRILEIRVHLAKEFVEDLKFVKDENADMLRETLSCSLKLPSMDSAGDIDDDGRPLKKP